MTKKIPSVVTKPPLLREHRLYQADWLLRFYNFSYDEIVTDEFPNLDEELDPKTFWALNNLKYFPMEINTASKRGVIKNSRSWSKRCYEDIKCRRFKNYF